MPSPRARSRIAPAWWSSHRISVVEDGELEPREEWTTGMVADLIRWAEAMEGRRGQDVYLFGHSAGGQFLSRVAAYDLPEGVDRVVIANPSTYVLPTADEEAPYGFGGFPEAEVPELTRRYLAAPVTIFLGEEDTGDEDLTRNEQADRQGVNRLDRGERTFEMARRVAEENGWPFNWRLVYAEDVGHSGRGMLQSDNLIDALR
jgi:pimeloyl-ACP methyl ester carboxylesterase